MWTSSPGRPHSYRFVGSNGSNRDRFPSPIRFNTADTVDSGIRRISAISAAVIRKRRNDAIARSRSSGVRRDTLLGAEERSTRPRRPSCR
jgi:hypothetical protein